MEHVIGLRCVICGETYTSHEVQYVCPKHGNEGILDVEYDYEQVKKRLAHNENIDNLPNDGMFAYRPFLPIKDKTIPPPLLVGNTPLYDARRMAKASGVEQIWVKDDGRNPTASFKDRASAIAVMKAQELGAKVVTTASTGNAAAALAGLAASTGQTSVIFVPASAPPAKVAQLQAYGAKVLLVDGTYDDAFELCLEATHEFGWYCRNTGYNPYMAEGKKTVTYELYDQLEGALPTHIFVSVGDGCIIAGVYKGLRDLLGIGRLTELPQLMGVQAAGSAFLYDAWQNGEDVVTKRPIAAKTVADSISAGLPRDRVKAMTAVRETNGAFIKVEDDEILAAIPALAQGSGVFAEPAAAAAYAGVEKAAKEDLLPADARVALLITGNGLKDVGAVMKATGEATVIQPKLSEVEKFVSDIL